MIMTKQEILDYLCRAYDVSPGDVVGPAKHPHIVRVRWLFCWALHKKGLSYSEIGRELDKDHTTILQALRRIPEVISRDELNSLWHAVVQSNTKSESVAQEIIEINVMLQGTIAPDALDSKSGAIVAVAMNRLAKLAAEAERLLKSSDDSQGA